VSRAVLPIDPLLDEIVATVRERSVLVLQAPPGAGKTTRVPAALVEADPGEVIVLEPRRIAARASAKRVAEERSESVGELVGYDVRFDRAVGPKTRLQYVTEGILARRLLEDFQERGGRGLRSVSTVILDEFHERHLQSDLALGLLQLARRSRADLRIVVMSATLDAEPIARFLDAPLLTSEGRRFEVAIEHAPRPDDRPLSSQIASALRTLLRDGLDGDVLVFLPGAAEIRKGIEACAPIAREADLILAPLHGDLPPAEQDAAIAPAPKRKVIFSTNVAETSVTIPGVVAVIDSGLARIAGYDPWTGRATLEVGKISRASATQRAGRAGRVREGRAIRLYTKGDHDSRREHDLPEVVRSDLSEAVLGLRAAGIDPRAFPWLTPPPAGAIDGAEALLARLGALSGEEPTEIGSRMLRFPLPPRLSRIVVEGERRGVGRDTAHVAAILAHGRDVYARSPGGPRRDERAGDAPSDLIAQMIDLEDRRPGIDRGAAAQIDRIRAQLSRLVDGSATATDPEAAIRIAILAGFPDRVARRRLRDDGRLGGVRDVVLASGGSAVVAEESVVRTAPWLVAVEAIERRGQTVISLASAIEPEWLIDLFPEDVHELVDVRWDPQAERVEATEQIVYLARGIDRAARLILDERPAGPAADHAIARVLADRAIAKGAASFVPGDALDDLRARLAFVLAVAPDLADRAGLRPLDDDGLRTILNGLCEGRRSFAELREAGLFDEIRAALGYEALSKLDELAPSSIVLGNGRRAKVSYQDGQQPSIASRLQDFFGSVDTPRVVSGRVPLVLHLLAPNGRDVQVTTDLAGFWIKHYPAIRSELMRRYPRHAWPEDPRNAAPPEPRRR
jgi:ATP-dependent helicase HrpB